MRAGQSLGISASNSVPVAAATLRLGLQQKAAMLCWLHRLLHAGGCQTAVPRLHSVGLEGTMAVHDGPRPNLWLALQPGPTDLLTTHALS